MRTLITLTCLISSLAIGCAPEDMAGLEYGGEFRQDEGLFSPDTMVDFPSPSPEVDGGMTAGMAPMGDNNYIPLGSRFLSVEVQGSDAQELIRVTFSAEDGLSARPWLICGDTLIAQDQGVIAYLDLKSGEVWEREEDLASSGQIVACHSETLDADRSPIGKERSSHVRLFYADESRTLSFKEVSWGPSNGDEGGVLVEDGDFGPLSPALYLLVDDHLREGRSALERLHLSQSPVKVSESQDQQVTVAWLERDGEALCQKRWSVMTRLIDTGNCLNNFMNPDELAKVSRLEHYFDELGSRFMMGLNDAIQFIDFGDRSEHLGTFGVPSDQIPEVLPFLSSPLWLTWMYNDILVYRPWGGDGLDFGPFYFSLQDLNEPRVTHISRHKLLVNSKGEAGEQWRLLDLSAERISPLPALEGAPARGVWFKGDWVAWLTPEAHDYLSRDPQYMDPEAPNPTGMGELPDGGAEAGAEAGAEGGTTTGPEGGASAGPEGGASAGSEGGASAGSEGGASAGSEGGASAGSEAEGMESPVRRGVTELLLMKLSR